MWLEKEELQALALAIDQLLGLPPQTTIARIGSAESVADFPEEPSVEFKIGRLGVGPNEPEGEAEPEDFSIVAHESEGEMESTPTFRCRVSRRQLLALSRQIDQVVAGGRPRCPYCGTYIPRGEPHACTRRNGHTHD